MKVLAETLDPVRFLRVHRSTIVNVECVRALRRLEGGEYEIVLEDGTPRKVSRTGRGRLHRVLKFLS